MDFVRQACAEFGGDRIAVGIDAKNGLVAVRGWTEPTTRRAADLALAAQNAGAGTYLHGHRYRRHARGTQLLRPAGPPRVLDCNLIASGGVACPDDLERLAAMPGLHGAIIGKALYEGKIATPLPNLK